VLKLIWSFRQLTFTHPAVGVGNEFHERVLQSPCLQKLKPLHILFILLLFDIVDVELSTDYIILWESKYKIKKKLPGFSPPSNYTDRATAVCRRS
jgi:hypothetical protein